MGSPEPTLLATQRPLTDEELDALVSPLGSIASSRLLSGGTFSAVHGVTLDNGRAVVVKTSVPLGTYADGRTALLGYEADMLRTEHDMLVRLGDVAGVPAPRVLAAQLDGTDRGAPDPGIGPDAPKALPPVQAIAMEWIPGTPWDTCVETMPAQARDAAWARVGEIMAALHTVTDTSFGYPALGFALGARDWPTAFTAIVESALADAESWGVDVEADRVRAALGVAGWALADVTVPRLVHNDLWFGNVLLDPASGEVYGVVDFERALFGDPLQDFCGSDSMNTGELDKALVAGYRRAGGVAGIGDALTESQRARLTLYRVWAMTVQAIEIVPRGFTGEWVVGHRQRIVTNRAALFAQLGV